MRLPSVFFVWFQMSSSRYLDLLTTIVLEYNDNSILIKVRVYEVAATNIQAISQ